MWALRWIPAGARAWVGHPGRGVIARTEVLGSCRSPEMAPALCRFRVSPYRAEKGFPWEERESCEGKCRQRNKLVKR